MRGTSLAMFGSLALLACGRGESSTGPPMAGNEEAPADGVGVEEIDLSSSASWDFEDIPPGSLPAGWIVESTLAQGPDATWQVFEDPTAPSGGQALGITSINHASSATFNLCWTDTASFQDGAIEVSFRSIAGEVDQGGGVIWRARDKDNYYIARFNPLEDNFRIYYVREGMRRMIADAEVALSEGEWHRMRILQHGDDFEGWLDGQKLLEGTDDHFPLAGGVGLWTKADAVTIFDRFSTEVEGD